MVLLADSNGAGKSRPAPIATRSVVGAVNRDPTDDGLHDGTFPTDRGIATSCCLQFQTDFPVVF
jgi:hypothetical protein